MSTTSSEITAILDKLIAQYDVGEYGKGEEALLGKAKKSSLASTSQSLVGSGLSGTTVGAGAGKKWEEDVGMPARLQTERSRMTGLSAALAAKAGYLQNVESQDIAKEQSDRDYAARMSQVYAQNKATSAKSDWREKYRDSSGGSSSGGTSNVSKAVSNIGQHIGASGSSSPFSSGTGLGIKMDPGYYFGEGGYSSDPNTGGVSFTDASGQPGGYMQSIDELGIFGQSMASMVKGQSSLNSSGSKQSGQAATVAEIPAGAVNLGKGPNNMYNWQIG